MPSAGPATPARCGILLLAGLALASPTAAPGGKGASILHFSVRKTKTNTGVEPDAAGSLHVKATVNQAWCRVAAINLVTNASYLERSENQYSKLHSAKPGGGTVVGTWGQDPTPPRPSSKNEVSVGRLGGPALKP